jgi:hypothetical protein
MDPNFNPPECYKKKDANGKYIEKANDCMTKCNFLPNCTAVCTNLVKQQVLYRDKPEEVTLTEWIALKEKQRKDKVNARLDGLTYERDPEISE